MEECRRRALLRTGAGLGLLGSASGCLDLLSGTDESAEGRQPLSMVPAGATAVVDVDVAALREDEAIRSAVDDGLAAGTDADGPSGLESLLESVAAAVGLDPRGIRTLTGVAMGFSTDDGALALARTDWSQSTLRESILEASDDVRTESYRDLPVFERELWGRPIWIALAGDGLVVAGLPTGVRGALDVRVGDGQRVGGDTRAAFEASHRGSVRAGVAVPADRLATRLEGEIVGSQTAGDLRYAFGSLGAEDSTRFLRAGLEATSPSTAETLGDAVGAGLALARGRLRERDLDAAEERLLSELETVSVSTEDTTVRLSYEAEATAFRELLGTALGRAIPLLGLESTVRAPRVHRRRQH